MKFICLRENITWGILTAARFSNQKGNLPILSNILIQAENTGLTLKATNLESSIIVGVQGKTEKTGELIVLWG